MLNNTNSAIGHCVIANCQSLKDPTASYEVVSFCQKHGFIFKRLYNINISSNETLTLRRINKLRFRIRRFCVQYKVVYTNIYEWLYT